MRAIPGAAAILSLAACATVPAEGEPPVRQPVDNCKPEAGQRFVGRQASSETGAAILAATGARDLRWLAPGMIVTMEYKYGRVGVSYDSAMTITRVSCG